MARQLIAGRYEVLERIGGGAQGEVYRVHDTHEGGVAALKLLNPLPGGGHWAEAQILRALQDDHILPIRNADLASGRPYLVTDLAVHGTLDDPLSASSGCGVGVDDVVRWIRQACFGVARGHDIRLLHSDVKPKNLFLNAEGECLVGDFGFAALLPPGSVSVAAPGATAETAAPELAAGWPSGAPPASVRTDVYSLGATAYWLLAGRPPHDLSGAADTDARMAIVAADVPPILRDVAPHVPQYVARAVDRAMARQPADRFTGVTEFAARLGTRPAVSRIWHRTDEHAGHLACFRGDPVGGGGSYVLCLEQGARPTQGRITTRHATSQRRVTAGCRDMPMRSWAQAARAVMDRLG
jgi:eukaryotic-like serine/threonine-protein kinase